MKEPTTSSPYCSIESHREFAFRFDASFPVIFRSHVEEWPSPLLNHLIKMMKKNTESDHAGKELHLSLDRTAPTLSLLRPPTHKPRIRRIEGKPANVEEDEEKPLMQRRGASPSNPALARNNSIVSKRERRRSCQRRRVVKGTFQPSLLVWSVSKTC